MSNFNKFEQYLRNYTKLTLPGCKTGLEFILGLITPNYTKRPKLSHKS